MTKEQSAASIAAEWAADFEELWRDEAVFSERLLQIALPSCRWRDLYVTSPSIRTLTEPHRIAAFLAENTQFRVVDAGQPYIHSVKLVQEPPQLAPCYRAVPWSAEHGHLEHYIQLVYEFHFGSQSGRHGIGRGVVKLRLDENTWKASTIVLSIDADRMGGPLQLPTYGLVDAKAKPLTMPVHEEIYWRHNHPYDLDRETYRRVSTQSPTVIIIGGGHAGLATAAACRHHGVPHLLLERSARVGDSWRLRHRALTLHTPTLFSSMPFMQYPDSYPQYMPKDLLADFLEGYAICLQLVVWTSTEVVSSSVRYDDKASTWRLTVRKDDKELDLNAPHVVFANGLHSEPDVPSYPGSDVFPGSVHHGSQWAAKENEDRSGRNVVVVGTANTAADVCVDCVNRGAKSVTMIQRSRACIASAGLLHKVISSVYPQDRPLAESDLLGLGTPTANLIEQLQAQVPILDMKVDGPMVAALEAKGLKCWWGANSAGAFAFAQGRGAHHMWDAGCAAKIIDGSIAVKSGVEIESFTADGRVIFTDKSSLLADEVVLCTGYKGVGEGIKGLLADKSIDLSTLSLLDPELEMDGCFRPTQVRNMWYAGGSFSAVRTMATMMIVHIKAIELGLVPPPSPQRPSPDILRNPAYHFGAEEDMSWSTYHSIRPAYPAAVFDRLFEFCSLSPASGKTRAIDVASGRGTLLPDLVPRFDSIIATDIDLAQLRKAEEEFSAHRATVSWRESTAEDLGWSQGHPTNLVITGEAIHWFDAAAFTREAYKTLRRGGVLCILFYAPFFHVGIEEIDVILVPLQELLLTPMTDTSIPAVNNARRLTASALNLVPLPHDQWVDVERHHWNQLTPQLRKWSLGDTYPDLAEETIQHEDPDFITCKYDMDGLRAWLYSLGATQKLLTESKTVRERFESDLHAVEALLAKRNLSSFTARYSLDMLLARRSE